MRPPRTAASVIGTDVTALVDLRGGSGGRRLRDRLLEVGELLAAARAELLEQHDVLLRLVELPGLDIELAQIFERALVLRVEIERLAIERVGLLVVAGLAQAEA